MSTFAERKGGYVGGRQGISPALFLTQLSFSRGSPYILLFLASGG